MQSGTGQSGLDSDTPYSNATKSVRRNTIWVKMENLSLWTMYPSFTSRDGSIKQSAVEEKTLGEGRSENGILLLKICSLQQYIRFCLEICGNMLARYCQCAGTICGKSHVAPSPPNVIPGRRVWQMVQPQPTHPPTYPSTFSSSSHRTQMWPFFWAVLSNYTVGFWFQLYSSSWGFIDLTKLTGKPPQGP